MSRTRSAYALEKPRKITIIIRDLQTNSTIFCKKSLCKRSQNHIFVHVYRQIMQNIPPLTAFAAKCRTTAHTRKHYHKKGKNKIFWVKTLDIQKKSYTFVSHSAFKLLNFFLSSASECRLCADSNPFPGLEKAPRRRCFLRNKSSQRRSLKRPPQAHVRHCASAHSFTYGLVFLTRKRERSPLENEKSTKH